MIGLLDLELIGPSTFPDELGLTVEVDEGNLSISDLCGDIAIETGDGDISVLGAGPGLVTAAAEHGEVEIEALGQVTISASGRAALAVPGVDHRPVEIETKGGPIVVEIVPQAMEITVQSDGGALSVDPTLGLEQVSDGEGGQYLMTDTDDFEGAWKLIRLTSHGGNVEIRALP